MVDASSAENLPHGGASLSRRDFLKLIGLGIGGSVCYEMLSRLPDMKKKGSFGEDLDYSQYPMYKFDNDTESAIADIRRDIGVQLLSPRIWGEGLAKNYPWLARDIRYLTEYIRELPKNYLTHDRSPKQIILLKKPGTRSPGAGGGYTRRIVMLHLAEDFSADSTMPGEAGQIYGPQRMHLKSRLAHEYTHSTVESVGGLLKDFIAQTGWSNKNGDWVNKYPKNLIREDNADHYPSEDIATSFGRLFINPRSPISDDRRQFFATQPFYRQWAEKVNLASL